MATRTIDEAAANKQLKGGDALLLFFDGTDSEF